MNVGDLVKNIIEPSQGLGIIMKVDINMWGQPTEPPGIKVLWANPTWACDDGGSIMYADEVMVISANR